MSAPACDRFTQISNSWKVVPTYKIILNPKVSEFCPTAKLILSWLAIFLTFSCIEGELCPARASNPIHTAACRALTIVIRTSHWCWHNEETIFPQSSMYLSLYWRKWHCNILTYLYDIVIYCNDCVSSMFTFFRESVFSCVLFSSFTLSLNPGYSVSGTKDFVCQFVKIKHSHFLCTQEEQFLTRNLCSAHYFTLTGKN